MTFDLNQVNGNPHDPLKAGPNNGRELFSRFSQAANGFPHEAVVDAAGNLLINAIRQHCATSTKAELAYDELMAKLKSLLLDQHYQNGARRNVFPFHQVIEMPLFNARDKK